MRVAVVGSGLGGVTLAEALAPLGHEVTLVTAETHGYYSRPRLSHGMALADEAAARIVMKPFNALKMRVLGGTQVESIDRAAKKAVWKGGSAGYDVLVLATGSAARIPPPLRAFREKFFTLNSYADLLALRACRARCLAEGRKPRWAVIGGGLIGCELASDLRQAGDAVAIFHRESRLLELQLDEAGSRALHEHFAALGVDLRYNQIIEAIDARFEGFDAIIVSTGFAPRVELAKEAGLAVNRGIVVDEFLRTADPAIYALGDAAEIAGRLYPFVSPIRSQALWLGEHLAGRTQAPWGPPAFTPVIKIHNFKLAKAA